MASGLLIHNLLSCVDRLRHRKDETYEQTCLVKLWVKKLTPPHYANVF